MEDKKLYEGIIVIVAGMAIIIVFFIFLIFLTVGNRKFINKRYQAIEKKHSELTDRMNDIEELVKTGVSNVLKNIQQLFRK